MPVTAAWVSLTLRGLSPSIVNRSSHNLAILSNKAFIFGGELKPRQPVGNEVIVVDLSTSTLNGPSDLACDVPASILSSSHSAADALSQTQTQWPRARVGASMVSDASTNSLFLWGGRAGKEMAAIRTRLESADLGLSEDVDDMWQLSIASLSWVKLNTTGDFPEPRSFHAMASANGKIYVHAGCPAQGRLSELHELDPRTHRWTKLADAPGPARGGAGLTSIRAPSGGDDLLARWGGFCGYELAGPLDVYDPTSGTWTSHEVFLEGSCDAEPPKRSVFSFTRVILSERSGNPVYVEGFDGEKKEALAIMIMGEGTGAPKELGHDGAGKFLEDAYLLLRRGETYTWLPLTFEEGSKPQARGWRPRRCHSRWAKRVK